MLASASRLGEVAVAHGLLDYSAWRVIDKNRKTIFALSSSFRYPPAQPHFRRHPGDLCNENVTDLNECVIESDMIYQSR
jgi:hypothetical protein